ncbi:MAG TPA: pimeloyl-ACP methyl ester esterase BioH [Casimicrobiaceae bacterium]
MTHVHVESVGTGPPLVVLHGWAMHSGLFAPLLPRLAANFRVHLVDLPGHGYSATVLPYTLDIISAVVAEAASVAVERDEPASVLGWSLGGMIALHWARTSPERIARLVLVAATPCFVKRPDWPHAIAETTLQQFGDELAVSYRLTLQRFVSLQVQGSEHARAVLAELRGGLFARGEPSREMLREGLELLARTDLRPEVGAILPHATVIAGDRDPLVPAAAGEWLARTLPHASLRLIPGAGHAPFLSHPDAFLHALADAGRP